MEFNVKLNNVTTVQDMIDILQKVPDKKVPILIEHNDHTDFTYKCTPREVYVGNNIDDGTPMDVNEETTLIIKFDFE